MTPTSAAISRPPTRGEDADRVGRVRARDARARARWRSTLRARPVVVDAGPAAGHGLGGRAGEDRRRARWPPSCCRSPSRRPRGDRRPSAMTPAATRRADGDRRERLGPGHRRLDGHVARSRRGSWRAISARRVGPGRSTVGIGPATPTSTTTSRAPDSGREDVDGRAAGDEVGDHLGGHLGRIGRHALRARHRGRPRPRRSPGGRPARRPGR